MIRLLPILALLVASCSTAATVSTITTESLAPSPGANSVVLVAELTGGCAMMGPNCERFVILGDGTVKAYRAGESAAQPVDIGAIDPALVATLHEVVRSTNLEALRKRLPPGECQGCVDGIDTLAIFTVDGAEVTFNSIDTELTSAEPAFATMWVVIDAAQEVTDIPVITH